MRGSGGPPPRRLVEALSRPGIALALVAGLGAVSAAYAAYGLDLPLRTDYLAMLTGASLLAHGGCLYCHAAQVHAQASLLGTARLGFDPFLETPVVALAYRPLLGLPFTAGFAVFLALSAACVAVSAALLRRRPGFPGGPAGASLLALTLLSLPAAWNYHLGQVDAVLVLPLAAGTLALGAGRPLTGGLLLSCLLLKPQTVWLVPVALLIARNWRALAGMTLGAALWAGASLALAGVAGVGRWLDLLGTQGPPVDTSIGIPGVVASIGGSVSGFVGAVALGLVAAGWLWRHGGGLRARPGVAVGLGVSLSLLLAPHVYAYDLIALGIPLALLGERRLAGALACALLVNATHLVDTLFIVSGPHLEALALLVTALVMARELAAPREDAEPRRGRAAAASPRPPAEVEAGWREAADRASS